MNKPPLSANSKRGASLRKILYRFETAWQSGERPEINDFLGDDTPQRETLLQELVLIDLEYRSSAGEQVRVESYLERFPELNVDALATMKLIVAEFAARGGEDESLDESAERFPSFRQALPGHAVPRQPLKRRVRMNCPHCSNPIVVIVVDGESKVVCPVCGTPFDLDAQREVSWRPEKLPKIDKFQLLEVIGRGAFGTVYRAHDTELHRTVAAKIPRSGQFSSQEDEDRFVREARSVAQLNHPGIVPVYEVGRTEDLPYIITEYVDGVPLSELLRSRRLQFEESADIIASVAESLQHAHSRGVIHRDLKPANIMLEQLSDAEPTDSHASARNSQSDSRRSRVRGRGTRTRLMDFGLARRNDGEITVTQEGQLLGTPAYMSPEQARGDFQEVDARSDVYSLGVILYEMLTGELPFRGSSRMVLHQVIHDEPSRPRKFVSQIPTDLETICLKCMEKERSNRYHTASELAEELNRFLNGQPILARPISSLDRVWRWCRRNPVVSGLTALLLVSLLSGLIGVTTQWRRAERNAANAQDEAGRASAALERASEAARRAELAAVSERQARLEAERAEQRAEVAAQEATRQAESARRVADFLVGIFQGADRIGFQGYRFGPPPDQHGELTARRLLDRGTTLIETELKDEPEIRSSLMGTIAEVYLSLGLLEDAEPLAHAALEIRRSLRTGEPDAGTARLLATLGMIRYIQGNYEASVRYFRDAVSICDAVFGELDPRGASIKLFYGFVVLESNLTGAEVDEAEEIINQVLKIRRQQDSPPPQDLAHALIGKGIIDRVRGRNVAALRTLAEAGMLLGSESGGARNVDAMLKAVQATVNWQNGQTETARQQTLHVIQQTQQALGSHHPIVTYLQIDFARRMFAAGEVDPAEALMREGIAACRAAYGRQPRTARALYFLGTELMNRRLNMEEAERLLRESAEIHSEVLGAENPRTLRAVVAHATALEALGRTEEAAQVRQGIP